MLAPAIHMLYPLLIFPRSELSVYPIEACIIHRTNVYERRFYCWRHPFGGSLDGSQLRLQRAAAANLA
jgi:hypothetical protein